MADLEVEETLRQIRERVRATAASLPADARMATATSAPVIEDGATNEAARPAFDALMRLEANLSTTERTQNRLPPLVSNRQGWAARLELWIKRKIKRATHWFTWEQVNFNAAAHAALRETLAALSVYEQHLVRMQMEMGALRQAHETLSQEFVTFNAQVSANLVEMRNTRTELHSLYTELQNSFASSCEHLRGAVESAHREVQALGDEQRERIAHLLEEQRVSFRQLALEASETAVLSDRARRRTDARLSELERRLAERLKETPTAG